MGVTTLHRKENGRQATYRIVDVEDATGDTYPHLFQRVAGADSPDGAHEYVGAGDDPDTVEERDEADRSSAGTSPSSLHNEMETLKAHIEYLERIEAVEDGLSEKVHVPTVPEEERSRDTRLSTDQALTLLKHYRNDDVMYGSRFHVTLELFWHTGARMGAIHGIDLQDFDPGERCVEFVHRPNTGTPLKNKINGERMVSLREPVVEAIQTYIRSNRRDMADEFGRSPLFTTAHGRASKTAIRTWCYMSTHPCVAQPCPHGHEKATCEFRGYATASQCPSAYGPHHVRTGSISWHRDRGVPKEITGERVNASEDVIDRYYDKSTKHERMELRRRPHLDKVDIEEEDDE
ncbi:MAG: tyrosine-type recombinase/integrase [Halolamina sp.]